MPVFLAVIVLGGFFLRYFLFNRNVTAPIRNPEALLAAREIAVERIQQMFPQADRRSILWDLQRNGGNMQTTTERILSGRLEAVRFLFKHSIHDFCHHSDAPPIAPRHLPASDYCPSIDERRPRSRG